MRMNIRHEHPEDLGAIYQVNAEAFGRDAEAQLVARLRTGGKAVLSLVAVVDRAIIGHLLFSPVTIAGASVRALGLAPLAVLPERQRSGVGTQLTRQGLAMCRDQGWDVVVVLGHREYYPRFGFAPAHRFGLRCEYDAPAESFMALEVRPGALGPSVDRLVRYAPEFGDL
jgi:putative acetyltransferase